MLDRAASAVGRVVLAVTGEALRATKRSTAWIALDRDVVSRIDVRISKRTSCDQFFFDFLFLDVGVFPVALDSRAERQCRAERRFGTRRNDQLAFLTFRAVEDVARIATFAQRAMGGVIDSETVVATETAQKPRAIAVRVVTQFHAHRNRPLRS